LPTTADAAVEISIDRVERTLANLGETATHNERSARTQSVIGEVMDIGPSKRARMRARFDGLELVACS
jgi:hypothetical protein